MLALLVALTIPAHAESWCAAPVVAHEWGVQVFRADGSPAQGLPYPSAYHTQPGARQKDPAVRSMPADSGVRCLPVIHFYGDQMWGNGDIPVGVEVGFTQGDASVWYPQVDRKLPRSADREQLAWDHLHLRAVATGAPVPTDVPWAHELRGFDDALWVEHDGESERFLFYEANTTERPAVRAHIRSLTDAFIANDSDVAVHDLLVVHVTSAGSWTATVPSLSPGARVALTDWSRESGEARLRAAITEPNPILPADAASDWATDCVMMRDPAEPFTIASDHRLYPFEADALLTAWRARFFEQPGTRVIYREDAQSLQSNMPLALYTDMHHSLDLHRLGLVLVEGIALD